MGFQEEEERPRPAFAAKAPFLEKNPITGVKEPSFPQSKRYEQKSRINLKYRIVASSNALIYVNTLLHRI